MKSAAIIFVMAAASLISSCDVEELLKTTAPPEVSRIFSTAGNFIVQPLDSAEFWVTAVDPEGQSLTYSWSVSGGSIIGSRSGDRIMWQAPLAGSVYSIKVTVSNSDKSTDRTEQITVPSRTAPAVNIDAPAEGSFLIQNSLVTVSVSASHENGIASLALYANDELLETKGGNTKGTYTFDWLIGVPAGQAELKAVATANITGAQSTDMIRVNIEGIIAGKLNGS